MVNKEVNFVEYPKIGGIYQHYKGGLYEVISLGKYSVDDSTVVIHKSILFGSVHVRPLSEWSDSVVQVTSLKGSGGTRTESATVKRFTLL